MGVLELLAQGMDISWVDDRGLVDSSDVLIAPKFLAAGTSSILFTAVDSAVPGLGFSDLIELAKEVPYIFLSMAPDQCSANQKMKQQVAEQLAPVRNVFMSPQPGCVVHGYHRVITSALREEQFIGDVHSISVLCNNVNHSNALVAAVAKLLESAEEFEYNVLDMPDPAWRVHSEQVLRFTIARDVRGSLDSEGVAPTLASGKLFYLSDTL
jgi:hypothetical protein